MLQIVVTESVKANVGRDLGILQSAITKQSIQLSTQSQFYPDSTGEQTDAFDFQFVALTQAFVVMLKKISCRTLPRARAVAPSPVCKLLDHID